MKIRINKNILRNGAIVFMLCAMLLGSLIYVANQSFAIGTLISFAVGPIYFFNLINNRKISKANVLMLGTLVFLVILSLIALFIFPSYENAQYLKAFAFAFFAFLIVEIISKNERPLMDIAILIYASIVLMVGLMQFSYIYFGLGLDPSRIDAENYVIENLVKFSSPRSIFTNPNDFAVVCLLLLIYFLFSSSLSSAIKLPLVVIILAMIIFSASRLCLVGMALVMMLRYFRGWKDFLLLILFLFLMFAILLTGMGFGFEFSDSLWMSKTLSILDLVSYYVGYGSGSISDGSADIRTATYLEFISNLNSISFGSFKAQDYSYFLSDTLMRVNPHSLLVELGLLYGYFGLAVFNFIMLWVFLSARVNCNKAVALGLCVVVFMITFASSSEINFPAFWVLLFMCFIALSTTSSKIRGSNFKTNDLMRASIKN